jgi:ADP-ribose pyrophosphatase
MANEKELIHEGKHLRFVRKGHWEYVERVRADLAVVIAAVTEEGNVLFIEQHRPPIGRNAIELPAGLVGDESHFTNEQALAAAKRELLEETGYEAEELEIVAEGPISPGLSNEMIALVVARKLRRIHAGGGVDSENITVHEVPLKDARGWLMEKEKSGAVAVDPKVYSGLYFL